ncbi:MAG: ABC transporter ATP-binding protein [Propionibacteriaceae bacterium]|nr:ABC transporter ATP-binding protein [Propionibacteriaceae bacterium]
MAVPSGCMFGFVGPNGAGKTTTLSMVTGLLRPDYGTIRLLDFDVWEHPVAAKALIGVLPDGLRLFDRLSGLEMLQLSAELHGISPQVAHERAQQLLEALDLAKDADIMVADYSAGMTKKIGLACALVHNPKLLILDEPFEAVDPVSGQVIREILRQFVAAGGTVIMSSHVMELVETLCDVVGVIAAGHLLAAGPLESVRAGKSLQDRFVELVGGRDLDGEGLSWLGQGH